MDHLPELRPDQLPTHFVERHRLRDLDGLHTLPGESTWNQRLAQEHLRQHQNEDETAINLDHDHAGMPHKSVPPTIPVPNYDTVAGHLVDAHNVSENFVKGQSGATLLAHHHELHGVSHHGIKPILTKPHTHEKVVPVPEHSPTSSPKASPDENREILIEALIGLDPERRRLYYTSIHFRAAIFTLAEMLPVWVEGLAAKATTEAKRISKRIAEEMSR